MKIGITAPVFITNPEHQRYLDKTTRSIVSEKHDIIWIPVENFVQPSLVPLPYVFDHEPDSISIVKPEGQQSVARAWNLGIDRAKELGCDYILVINTDIVFKSNAIDRLVKFADSFKDNTIRTNCQNGEHLREKNIRYPEVYDCELCDPENITTTSDYKVKTFSFPEVAMWTMSEWAELVDLEQCPEDENFSEHPHFSCFMVKTDFFDHVGRFDENFIPAYCEDGDMHARLALGGFKALIYGGAKFYHFGSRTIKSDQMLWQSNTKTFPKNQQYFLEKWGHPPVNEVERMRKVYFKHPYNEADKSLDYWRKETL